MLLALGLSFASFWMSGCETLGLHLCLAYHVTDIKRHLIIDMVNINIFYMTLKDLKPRWQLVVHVHFLFS